MRQSFAIFVRLVTTRMRIDDVRCQNGSLFGDQRQLAAICEARIDAENAFATNGSGKQELFQICGEYLDGCGLGSFGELCSDLTTDQGLH